MLPYTGLDDMTNKINMNGRKCFAKVKDGTWPIGNAQCHLLWGLGNAHTYTVAEKDTAAVGQAAIGHQLAAIRPPRPNAWLPTSHRGKPPRCRALAAPAKYLNR